MNGEVRSEGVEDLSDRAKERETGLDGHGRKFPQTVTGRAGPRYSDLLAAVV